MGSSVCAEMQHKFHHSHQLYNYPNKKTLREIDIPPRKLIGRRSAAEFLSESPNSETAIFRQFLPYNDDDDDDDDDPYSADEFRMFEFKVRKCNRSRSHDWTDCPFAHPGEKARRRDPRKYNYNGTVCPEFRKGYCRKGDLCEFAHGVFECWLHPSRYRTEACKDGKNCKRKVCFFVHSARQLRLPPDEKINNNHNHLHCCVHCHNTINANSPTSTLLGMSHLSPPVSPDFNSGRMSYKDAVNELMSSLEAMNIMKDSSSPMSNSISNSIQNVNNFPWIDVNFSTDDQTTQFNLSPSTPSPSTKFAVNNGDFPARNLMMMEEIKYNNEGGLAGPDLEWVNALLT